jgi:quercetin dioxygenase-like cupin family protein
VRRAAAVLPRHTRARVALIPVVLAALVAVVVVVPAASRRGAEVGAHEVQETTLLDNDRMLVVEFVFPPGFRGEEHEAPVDEFAYVLEGEFAVITRGRGKSVVRQGAVEWARKGDVHYSVNETKRPARVLVVLLKER